jgi:hypothetical protein
VLLLGSRIYRRGGVTQACGWPVEINSKTFEFHEVHRHHHIAIIVPIKISKPKKIKSGSEALLLEKKYELF